MIKIMATMMRGMNIGNSMLSFSLIYCVVAVDVFTFMEVFGCMIK